METLVGAEAEEGVDAAETTTGAFIKGAGSTGLGADAALTT